MITFRNTIVSGFVAVGLAVAPSLAGADDSAKSVEILNNHLKSFGAGDLEGLLADYSEDAYLMTPNSVVRGKENLRSLYEALFEEFGKKDVVFNLTHQSCDGEICLIVWDAETPDNSYEFATDTFVMEDGKIVAQTLALKSTPKEQ